MIVWTVLQVILGFNFLFPFLLFIASKLSGKQKPAAQVSDDSADYAIIVTAYEETGLLESVANSILELDYHNYLIYIVADNCDISNLRFTDERVVLLRPPEVLASNVKSHFYAINNFQRAHDRITIIDSDNLVDKNYLKSLNQVFDQGFQAVQGVRRAKKINTTYAALDEAGDIYYRYVDRKLLFESGSSASLAGSGMAFTLNLYKDCLSDQQLMGAGFDKILQYEIIRRGHRIAFSEAAIVYDEKTAKSDQLVKQRARWINTWFKFFFLGINLLGSSISKFNLNGFLFSILLLRPPLFLLILLSGSCFVIDLFLFPYLLIFWMTTGILFLFVFFRALAYFKADEKIYQSLKGIPKFIFYQILAFTKVRKANKLSVATKHVDENP